MSQNSNTVLVVDDDKAMRTSLVELLEAAGWRVHALARATLVAENLADVAPDVIVSDVRMPGMSGLELLASLDAQTTPPIVLISAHGDIPMAVQAMQDGAYSFVEKPYDPRRLLTILEHAAHQHQLARTTERLRARLTRLSGLDRVLLGQTPAISALREEVLDIAETDAAVLLLGETGTGKELVARALHNLSHRADGPFVALNCATIPADHFETEMFGVKSGAPGRILSANGGTLFLDEICACPPEVQAKLLRVIEAKEVTPVGGDAAVSADFRVLSASNETPEEAVAAGRFRSDLLFRINTVVLNLPTLRDRRDDLAMLFTHFLGEFAQTYETNIPPVTQPDLAALLVHDWPGNVRELRHVAERFILASRRGTAAVATALRLDVDFDDMPQTLREAVAALERQMIARALRNYQGRMDTVADALGIGRRTLNEKIVKLGLDKDALL